MPTSVSNVELERAAVLESDNLLQVASANSDFIDIREGVVAVSVGDRGLPYMLIPENYNFGVFLVLAVAIDL